MNRPFAILPLEKGTPRSRAIRYRERAEVLRNIANDLLIDSLQRTFRRVASTYDRMAADAERMFLTH